MERDIERKITKKMRERGWFDVKLMQTNRNGMPDRMFLKAGRVFFVEFKSRHGRLSELQKLRIGELRTMGFHVLVVREN